MNNENVKNETINISSFTPNNSGNIGRSIIKARIKPEESSALDQVLGVKAEQIVDNANSPFYSGQVNFPQPSVIGFGKVTSAGAKSTPFLADTWAVAKNSTGNYTITHNIGDTNYVVQLTPEDSNPRIIGVSGITSSVFVIKTTSDAGTLTDTAFHFIVYKQ